MLESTAKCTVQKRHHSMATIVISKFVVLKSQSSSKFANRSMPSVVKTTNRTSNRFTGSIVGELGG